VLAHVIEHTDVRVVQSGDSLRFALEARATVRVGADFGRQDLDGDRAVEARIAGFVDLAHPTRADGGEDLIRAEANTNRERHGGPFPWLVRVARGQTGQIPGNYCSLAYSALAAFRIGTSESASFQSVRKSW